MVTGAYVGKISYVRVCTRVGFIDWKVQCPRPMTQERHTLVNVCENTHHNQRIHKEGMYVHVASLGIL